ncbi:MAG: DUF1015 domain-containing protein [Lachnospiraceae bacterium]|nr:DUF1015 domain-containing protein [Lachnospiraceae bacterium]
MSTISPFCAVRPAGGLEEKIAALPYDVYNRAEAKAFVSKNPDSFLMIDRPETVFPDDFDMYSDEAYEKAKELYENKKKTGEFVKEVEPCFYLYELTMGTRVQTGLVCLASVDEYLDGTIKKHENTRADKEVDRIRHVDALSAQTGPIFLAYRAKKEILDFIKDFKDKNAPEFDFTSDDGIRHRGFKVSDKKDTDFLTDAFYKVPNLYIADGHHRCASAAKVCLKRREEGRIVPGSFEGFLSVVFPDSDLMIMDYNRVILDPKGLSEDKLIELVKEKFDVKEIKRGTDKPSRKGEIFMILKDREFSISLKKELLPKGAVESLDVSILQDFLLEPVFNIKDPKTDKTIDFVGGIRGVKELIRRVDEGAFVSFAMYPTAMSELFSVADAGLLMPPKSTWFEPKLRSGLFINEF